MEVHSEISRTSRGTAGTAATSRALGLLESIKQATKPSENQDFIKILSLFKQKKISSSEAFERVSHVLANYPKLLNEFKSYLPVPASGSNVNFATELARPHYGSIHDPSVTGEFFNQTKSFSKATVDGSDEGRMDYKPQFNNALAFVQKVKMTYKDEPQVYEKFLLLLKNYQRGVVSQLDVCTSVGALLSRTPGLAHEFRSHYGPLDQKSFSATNPIIDNISALPRADSNDTIISQIPTSLAQHDQHRTISFSSSVPMASAVATTITPDNYIESTERDPLLGNSHRNGLTSQTIGAAESQIVDELEGKRISPNAKAMIYFSMFFILFIGTLIAAFYFGLLNLPIFEMKN